MRDLIQLTEFTDQVVEALQDYFSDTPPELRAQMSEVVLDMTQEQVIEFAVIFLLMTLKSPAPILSPTICHHFITSHAIATGRKIENPLLQLAVELMKKSLVYRPKKGF